MVRMRARITRSIAPLCLILLNSTILWPEQEGTRMPAMRRNDRLRLDYKLTFTTPFHCGTGLRAGLVDRTVRRDHEGYLYIPGSTLKGVLRERCEQVARLYEELDPAMREALA